MRLKMLFASALLALSAYAQDLKVFTYLDSETKGPVLPMFTYVQKYFETYGICVDFTCASEPFGIFLRGDRKGVTILDHEVMRQYMVKEFGHTGYEYCYGVTLSCQGYAIIDGSKYRREAEKLDVTTSDLSNKVFAATIAHEIGHLCGLEHVLPQKTPNLMEQDSHHLDFSLNDLGAVLTTDQVARIKSYIAEGEEYKASLARCGLRRVKVETK